MAMARMALAMATTSQSPLLLTLPHSNFIRNGAVLRTTAAAAPIAQSLCTISTIHSFSLATTRFPNLAILARATELGSENAATEAKPGDIATESESEGVFTEAEALVDATESKVEGGSTEAETLVDATEANSGDIATEAETEGLAADGEAQDDATEAKSGDIAGTEGLATEGEAQGDAAEAESDDIAGTAGLATVGEAPEEGLAAEAESGDLPLEEEIVSEVPPEHQGLKLYVGNLPWSCDSTQLAEICQDFGVVDTVEVVFEPETGRSRGFAFVTMASNADARAVLKALDGSELGGRPLKVDFPRPNKNNPRIVSNPPSSARGRPGNVNKVFVSNFPWACDDQALALLFSGYGEVVEAKVVYDRETGRSRGFGFVTMGNAAEVNAVIENLNGADYEGRELRVTLVEKKAPRSPSH